MTARRVVIAVVAATGLGLLVLLPAAGAADVFDNVAPASQLPSGALMDAHPLGAYLLDHHFDAVKAGVLSGVDVSGIPPTIAWFLAQLLWQLTALLAYATITVFTFAFSLDLVNGSAATGGNGALAPVADAIDTLYTSVFGAPWLTVAVLLTGMWAMWHSLVRRRHVETIGALGMSVLYVTIALAFVTQPERTIGQASRWTNELSGAFLSLSANGTVVDHDDAKREVSDQLFKLLVYDPWVVLNFGGLEHCVTDDGDPVAVRPLSSNPARDAQLSRQLARGEQIDAEGKVCVNNRLKYAEHFLRFEFESDPRNAEYEALKAGDAGKLPDEDPGKRDGTYRLSAVDKPAAESMGKGGQYQRLALAFVILAGEIGAFLLLGSLSIMVIVAQVLVLLLLAFAPIVLVVAVFPGRGHDLFLSWLQRLAAFLLRKAIFSLILAVLLAVSAALQAATGNLGWLMAFGMQAAFFWTVFLSRHQLAGQLSTAVTGTAERDRGTARLTAGMVVAGYAAGRMGKGALRFVRRARTSDGPSLPPQPEPPQPQLPQPEPPSRPDGPAPTAGDPRPGSGSGNDGGGGGSSETSGPAPDSSPPPTADAPQPAAHAAAERPAPEEGPAAPAPAPPPPPSRRGEEPDRADAAERVERPAGDRHQPVDGGPAPRREQPPAEEHAAPPPPAAAHDRATPAAQAGGGASPLMASLRRDAQRLHHDARRLHDDARRSSEQRDGSPAAPPRPRRGSGRP